MKANLFKNFKTLKEKEEEIKNSDNSVLDNVSELKEDVVQLKPSTKKIDEGINEIKAANESLIGNKKSVNEKNSSTVVVKKRPIKKEILEAKAALISNSPENTVEYSKKITSEEGKRTFTIFLKSTSLEFLKDLVFYKATAERQIFYNQSEAITEALGLTMNDYKNISPRPDFIKEQEKSKKGGRKRNSDEIYDASTTVYISSQSFDFVKDVTYNKVIAGDLYFKDWDLLESAILKLKDKYGNNIQPRPDYIREDEKLRGRRKSDM